MGINCVPGTFVTNTGCQKCPNGTFSDKNNATKCSPCDRCFGRHNEIVKPCTSYSNTNCSCQSGYYYSTSLAFCLKCTQCKKGRGVVRSCTATGNTECDLCVKVRDQEIFCVTYDHGIPPHLIYTLSSRRMMRVNEIDLAFVQAHLNASFSLQNQVKDMLTRSALKNNS